MLNVKSFSSMTGSDCYQLALQLSSNKKYQTAGHWYEEALKRFDDTTLSVSKDIILGELALMYSLSGKLAFKFIENFTVFI